MGKNMRSALSKIINFITTDIWRINLNTLPRNKSIFVKILRMLSLAVQGFRNNKSMLRASALTFFTLLSIVPVVAMAFGIAKGFGFEDMLDRELRTQLPGQEMVVQQVVGFAHSLLENTKGGMVAGFGVVLLIWSVVKLLGQIEEAFNEIWEIKTSRTAFRKFSDYLAIMLIGPIFLVSASSATLFVTTQLAQLTEKLALLRVFGPVILVGLKILPCFLIGILFAIIYMVMPNTRVKAAPGLLAGMIAGATYAIVQWGYISFQVGIAKYNAIYGSFAALPLFLIWLQVSWIIVLFGAEISFAIQNAKTYAFKDDLNGISIGYKKLVALQISHLIIRKFSAGEKPLTVPQIADTIEAPIPFVRHLISELLQSGIITNTTAGSANELAYLPARDINLLSVKTVVDALEQKGADNIPVAKTRESEALSDILHSFNESLGAPEANKLLKDV
jgi:membrane protein